jgi:phage terminase large subunit-like protein
MRTYRKRRQSGIQESLLAFLADRQRLFWFFDDSHFVGVRFPGGSAGIRNRRTGAEFTASLVAGDLLLQHNGRNIGTEEFDSVALGITDATLDLQFIGNLTLTKSTKSGRPEPFILLDFQADFIARLLGRKHPDGRRVYRRSYFSLARKSGKSQLMAALGLDLLILDCESKPEIYVGAKSVDQASIIFQQAAEMVRSSAELSEVLEILDYKKLITNRATGGLMQSLSSEGGARHGLNASAILLDELHVFGAAEESLYRALTTSQGARRQPLHVTLTTAGHDANSLCGQEYDYAKRVLKGTIDAPDFLGVIYETPADADWTDESTWPAANPGLGAISHIEEIRSL